MNELQAANERIADLERELAAAKERNGKLHEMLTYYWEEEEPPMSQEEFEEIIRNPAKESLSDLIREHEVHLKG